MTRVTSLRWIFGLLAAATLAYAAHAITGIGDESLFVDWVYSIIEIVAAAVCVARAVLVRRERAAWALIAANLVLWTAGDLIWMLWLEHLDSVPFPCVADAVYYAAYPALYAGVVLLLRARLRPFR